MKPPESLLAFLQREKEFFIATHISPDGDALGSSLALAMALESLEKKTIVYCKDPVPKLYKFLRGSDRFTNSIPDLISNHPPLPLVKGGEGGFWNLILIDCSDLERAELEKIKFNFSAVIDHHETVRPVQRELEGIKWIEPKSPATGLMVFYLINELGVKITKDIATNLYSAIAIDTGTFRYSNTNPEVLIIAAELIESGADPSYIAENLYETWSENRFRLLLRVLHTLEVDDNVAIVFVTQDMFKETGTLVEDTENFPSFPRMLKTTKVAALFREIESNYYKVSLRSKGGMNVAKIAEAFGGGGHRNAAGYKVRSDFKAAKESLLKAIRTLPR